MSEDKSVEAYVKEYLLPLWVQITKVATPALAPHALALIARPYFYWKSEQNAPPGQPVGPRPATPMQVQIIKDRANRGSMTIAGSVMGLGRDANEADLASLTMDVAAAILDKLGVRRKQ